MFIYLLSVHTCIEGDEQYLLPITIGWCSSNAPYLYSGGAWFKPRPGHRLLWQIIHYYPQSLQANVGIVQVCHKHLLPNPFQFTVHQPSYHLTIYNLRYRQHHKTDHKKYIYSHSSQSENLETSLDVNFQLKENTYSYTYIPPLQYYFQTTFTVQSLHLYEIWGSPSSEWYDYGLLRRTALFLYQTTCHIPTR